MNRIIGMLVAFLSIGLHSAVYAKTYRIGIVQTVSLPIVNGSRNAFTQELERLMPKDELEFVILNAEGSLALANEYVSKMHNEANIDLLATVATLATRAAFNHPSSGESPMLFLTVADPIGEGIVEEFGQNSAKNITGESHVLAASIKLDMLDGLISASNVEKPMKIALIHSTYPSSTNLAQELLALDQSYENVEFVEVITPFVTGEDALQKMCDEIIQALLRHEHEFDGYWLSTGPLSQAEGLVQAIQSHTSLLPIFAENISAVKDGALMGVVSDVESIGQTAARTAKRILQGEAPQNIPVKRMDKYTMAVNISTAIKLDMAIPSAYLKLSKHHVYQ